MFGGGRSFGAPAPPTRSPLPLQLFFERTRLPLFSTACALLPSLLCTRAQRISFSFNHLRTLCGNTGDGIKSAFQFSRPDRVTDATAHVSPLQSALTDERLLLPRFGRKSRSLTPAFPALTGTFSKSFRIRTCRKKRGGLPRQRRALWQLAQAIRRRRIWRRRFCRGWWLGIFRLRR